MSWFDIIKGRGGRGSGTRWNNKKWVKREERIRRRKEALRDTKEEWEARPSTEEEMQEMLNAKQHEQHEGFQENLDDEPEMRSIVDSSQWNLKDKHEKHRKKRKKGRKLKTTRGKPTEEQGEQRGVPNATTLDEMFDRKRRGRCASCGIKVNVDDFRDERSKQEFRQSGFCQVCQDDFFR